MLNSYKKLGYIVKGLDAVSEEMRLGHVPGTKSLNLKLSKNVDAGKQEKHIEGKNNYSNLVKRGENPSILSENAQSLLDEVHAGKVVSIQPAGDKFRVDFGKPIGFFVDKETGVKTITTVGLISDSKKGAHIVPGQPNK